MAAYWEIAAYSHSAFVMLLKYMYKYLFVNYVFPTSIFEVGFLLFLIIAQLYFFHHDVIRTVAFLGILHAYVKLL